MREKAWSTLIATIHQRPEICHLGMHFVHKWVRKRPCALCKSCRGILDLQLSYLHLSALQFNFLELHSDKQSYLKIFEGTGYSETRRPRRRRAPPAPWSRWARTPRPTSVCQSARRGTPLRRTAFPSPHSSCATRRAPRGQERRPCRHRPLASLSYPPHVVAVPWCVAPHTATTVLARKAASPPLFSYKSRPPSPRAQSAPAEPLPLPWTPTRCSTRRSA
jgi:hypothetical protein